MEFITIVQDYKVYKNDDGFMELYKTIGKVDNYAQYTGADIKRVVTRFTTIAEVETFLHKTKLKTKPPKNNPNLFPND